MDRLAAVHLSYGFLNVPAHRRRHATSPNCQNLKASARSLSLADRRGILSRGPWETRGLVSPLPRGHRDSSHSMKKLHDMTMVMQAMDYDRFSADDPIGEIMMPMKTVKFEKSPIYWKNLHRPTVSKEQVGELIISLCYCADYNKLNVTVVKARDLPNRDRLGTSDPYVKLWLVQKGNKLEKRKTAVKPQTLMPIFNESFAFNVPPKDKMEAEVNLVVTVMDYDLLSSNNEIGHVILGSLGTESGSRHWRQVMEHPDQAVTLSHKLTPKW
ncbi:c2 domain-containing protein [Ditylenchus destructor]|nr:c2 domain-containing protein [Ditylenchus destructor]